MEPSKEARIELEKHAEILRSLIRHENEVTNHRTAWLLVSQGILLAAAAAFVKIHWFPTIVVGALGLGIAISIAHSLSNSFDSRQYFKNSWRDLLDKRDLKWEDFPPLDGGFPGLKPIKWLAAWKFIPRALIVGWVLLIGYFATATLCAI
ncbi:MAG TPA: hypothetical protein VE008_02195 [Burkholderiales bacterium]|nr:hypothetical protein [Burkholderiales bacterium]